MAEPQYRGVLYGASSGARRWGLGLAVGLGVVTYVGLIAIRPITGTIPTRTPFVVALWLAVLGAAGTFAFFRDGLVVCVLLATAPVTGWVLAQATVVESYPPYPDGLDLLVWGVGNGSIFGVPLGALGFLLGAGADRIRGRSR